MAAKPEKNNAKSPRPVPTKIPVNGGTEGSVPTPTNLGVPTPPNPFDPAAAMGALAPAGPDGSGPARTPFQPEQEAIQQVQGMIFHWNPEDLRNLITFAAHLLTQKEKDPNASQDANASPGDSNPPAEM